MDKDLTRKYIRISLTAVLVAVAFLAGSYLGYSNRPAIEKVTTLFGKEDAAPATVDFNAFLQMVNCLIRKKCGGQ
jgi:hypothetical protein